jgi:microcin C transport system substrate-binding protein
MKKWDRLKALGRRLGLMLSAVLLGWVAPTMSVAAEFLPDDIRWVTNDSAPLFAAPEARKGGTYRTFITSFPLTLRQVGPDSNGVFAGVIYSLDKSLLSIHPNTEEILPSLATHWAYGDDNKTMYFKLNPSARWSDGKPVTADDYLYTLEFMRSKHIVAPFYNNYYTNEIEKVIQYDDHTIAVVSAKEMPELHMRLSISPTPRHFYGEVPEDFVRRFNWSIAPNTGPYDIDEVNKGKYITLKRKTDWWGQDLKYFKGRYNVDTIRYTVIRDVNSAFEFFRNDRLDAFALILPDFWHEKARDLDIHQKGYIHKIWFYNDTPQPSMGFWLNQAFDLFQDRRLRYAFAHAINMEKLLTGILRGDYSRLHQHYAGYGAYSDEAITAREFSIETVEQLMTSADWKRGAGGIWEKDGRRYVVTVNYSAEHHTQRLVVLKEEARKAGIELNLKRMDGSADWKLNLEKKHEAAWTGFSTSLRPRYWQHYHSENAFQTQTNNFTNTADPELDRLIEQYESSLEIKERIRLSRIIQAKLHEIGAFVPAYKVGYYRGAHWRWWRFPEIPATKHSDDLFDELGTALFWCDEMLQTETRQAMRTGRTFEPVTRIDTTFKPD